jgi:maleate isomerase
MFNKGIEGGYAIMYGWRGRVGFITPSHAIVRGHEFEKIAPEGVKGIETRVLTKQSDETTPDRLSQGVIDDIDAQLDRASAELATAEVDVIAQCGTPVGFMGEPGYHEEIKERIEGDTDIPAITMMGSVIESVHHLDKSRLYLMTYYDEEFNKSLIEYLEAYDVEVVGSSTLQVERPVDFGKVPPERVYNFVRRNLGAEMNEIDCLFLGGGGLRTIELIDPLEKDLETTVVSSSISTFWNALETIGVHESFPGYGKLLNSLISE